MKKLLSLLSVLTISGTAVPTTIAASPYLKEETIKNNDINYQQTNNLEKLNRIKRNNDSKPIKINTILILNKNKKYYINSANEIINELVNNNILNIVFENSSNSENIIYAINNDANNFIVTVFVDNEFTIDLLFTANNLYLQGFTHNTTFYHFSDSTIRNINGQTSSNLGFNGNYPSLLPNSNPQITWENILQSFNDLNSYGQGRLSPNDLGRKIKLLKAALFRIILVTSEALRFRSIHDLIVNQDGPIYWNPDPQSGQTNIHNIVTNWQSISNNIIHAINNIQTRFGINNELSISDLFYNFLSQLPLNAITRALSDADVRIVLGLIIRLNLNCNREKRNQNTNTQNKYCNIINNNFNGIIQEKIKNIKIDKNEGIYILTKTGKVYFVANNDKEKPIQINSLNNKFVTSIEILENDSPINSNLKAGIVYFGTTEGVYFSYKRYKNNNNVRKIEGLNEEIAFLSVDKNGSANIITKAGKKYFISYDSWTAAEINNLKDCSFTGIFFTPVWKNWYRLIPGYDAYHLFSCL